MVRLVVRLARLLSRSLMVRDPEKAGMTPLGAGEEAPALSWEWHGRAPCAWVAGALAGWLPIVGEWLLSGWPPRGHSRSHSLAPDGTPRIKASGAFPRLPDCLQPSPWLQGYRSAAGPRLAVFYGDLQRGTRCPASPGHCKGCTCPPKAGHCKGCPMRRVCGWRLFQAGGRQREPARTTCVGCALLFSSERAAVRGQTAACSRSS